MAKINYKAITLTLGLIAFSFLFVWYVFAQWQEPTTAPPGDNVPAPINVGPITQTKTGDLNLATDSGALVGIGTTTPRQKLDVNGSIVTGSGHLVTGNSNGALVLNAGATGDIWFRNSGSVNGDGLVSPYTNQMVIKSSGNVGIGTTSPTNFIGWPGALQVNGEIRAARYYDDASTASTWYIDINTTSLMNTIDLSGTIYSNWFRSKGNTGWYSQTYGGGWYMQDTTWIRAYNNKRVYTGGEMRSSMWCDSSYDVCVNPLNSTWLHVKNRGNTVYRGIAASKFYHSDGGVYIYGLGGGLDVRGNIRLLRNQPLIIFNNSGAYGRDRWTLGVYSSNGTYHRAGDLTLSNCDVYSGGDCRGQDWRLTFYKEGSIYSGIYVNGSIRKTGSNLFSIPHPLDPENKQLEHASIEGPESAVYYRGEGQLKNGKAVVELPDYFEALTAKEDRTVLLTPKFEGDEPVSQLAASAVEGGTLEVRAINDQNLNQKFYWEVKAVRADVSILEVERSKK